MGEAYFTLHEVVRPRSHVLKLDLNHPFQKGFVIGQIDIIGQEVKEAKDLTSFIFDVKTNLQKDNDK